MPEGDWVSVETGGTMGGVPDSNYCFPGGFEGWVEGKLTHTWKVNLRPSQIGWLSRRSRRGGRCFVFVRRVNRGDDELWAIWGSDVEEFSRSGASLEKFSPIAGLWKGGPSRWNWAEIKALLLT
jgi:hypothetical protein